MAVSIGPHSVQTPGDVLQGIGVGEAQEAFGVLAEVDARRDAHMGLFQDVKGQG